MNPEHLELLRRALPHLSDPQVVEAVVGALSQGSDYPVPDISTVEYLDFAALRLCFWKSSAAEKKYPGVSKSYKSFIEEHSAALRSHLDIHESRGSAHSI